MGKYFGNNGNKFRLSLKIMVELIKEISKRRKMD
jgi:hypothetical protein